MREPKSRLDDLNDIILNVANKNGSLLDLSTLPDSKLKLPESVLRAVPASFKDGAAEPSLTYGFDYFSPGMKVVVLGGKNLVLSYIAARRTTPGGCVINCFSNPNHMEKSQEAFGELPKKQFPNLQFYYTPNGDLTTRYPEIETFLDENAVEKVTDYLQLERFISDMRNKNPLIEDNSVDMVALDTPNFDITSENLWNLASDVYRILKRGGIFLFSLLLSDEKVVENGDLWEGDMEHFTHSLQFHGLHWLGRSELPYRVINGKEVRYYNFAAFKGKEGACMERKQAVIYNGPWSEVKDDDGHVFPRGKRAAVCDKTFNVMSGPPYSGQFTYLRPYIDIPLEQAAPFPCASGIIYRHPKETKGVMEMNPASQDGSGPEDSTETGDCCDQDGDGSGCC
jgi:arsenite methyltransferase